jgi:hypothetical protein
VNPCSCRPAATPPTHGHHHPRHECRPRPFGQKASTACVWASAGLRLLPGGSTLPRRPPRRRVRTPCPRGQPARGVPGGPVQFFAAALANRATPRLTWRHRRTRVVPVPLYAMMQGEADGTPDLRPSTSTVPALAFTGEVHRLRARFSPVNFTEFPRVRVPVNSRNRESATGWPRGVTAPGSHVGSTGNAADAAFWPLGLHQIDDPIDLLGP